VEISRGANLFPPGEGADAEWKEIEIVFGREGNTELSKIMLIYGCGLG
jgi:hypothetical protein